MQRDEGKSLEEAGSDMRTITKITQMLDLIRQSGCETTPGNLEQLLFYNRTDVNYKTMTQFEPSQAFAVAEVQVPVARVGEHESYVSDKELGGDSSDETEEASKIKVKPQKVAEQEFDQLAKRSYMVRRGRNNRLLVRPIL